jgi:hypothetical protein
LARQIAVGSAGNIFIADGNHGAVPIDRRGLMDVRVMWKSGNQLVISYPPDARVFKAERQFQSVTVKYDN